jgi:hypothetical protein
LTAFPIVRQLVPSTPSNLVAQFRQNEIVDHEQVC